MTVDFFMDINRLVELSRRKVYSEQDCMFIREMSVNLLQKYISYNVQKQEIYEEKAPNLFSRAFNIPIPPKEWIPSSIPISIGTYVKKLIYDARYHLRD